MLANAATTEVAFHLSLKVRLATLRRAVVPGDGRGLLGRGRLVIGLLASIGFSPQPAVLSEARARSPTSKQITKKTSARFPMMNP